MKKTLDIKDDHLTLILGILQQHLPVAKIWVYGSRAKGNPKTYSDLDLAIDAGKKLSLDQMASLANEFEESELPYKVDIIDWLDISDSFRQNIQDELVLLYSGDKSANH